MRRANNPLVYLSVGAIKKVWQGKIGPKYKEKKHVICRFYPDCSNYGIFALEKYGFIRGWQKTAMRVTRCTPDNYDTCFDTP